MSTDRPELTLANLAGHTEYLTERATALAIEATEVPYGAQAAHALAQAAVQLEVARAYLEAAQRDAQRRTADTSHHHPEPCQVCGASLPFAPAEGALPRCAFCQGLAEPTGLSVEATRRLARLGGEATR